MLEFDMDESGCFLAVVNHHIAEKESAYYVGPHLKLKGREVMDADVGQHGETVFMTGVTPGADTWDAHLDRSGRRPIASACP